MPSNTDAKARVVVAKSILQHLADLQYGTEEYTPEANEIREAYAELSKSALKGDSKAKSALGSAVRDWVTNPQSKIESRDSLSRAFDLAIVANYPHAQVDLAEAKKDPLAMRLAENAVSSEADFRNILKTAYLQVQSKYGDKDESFQGRALVGAIKRGAFSASSGVKALVGKLLSTMETKDDKEVAEFIFSKYLDPQSLPDGVRPSTREDAVDRDQQSTQVSRRSIFPTSPYASESNPSRDKPAIGLSECQFLDQENTKILSNLDTYQKRMVNSYLRNLAARR